MDSPSIVDSLSLVDAVSAMAGILEMYGKLLRPDYRLAGDRFNVMRIQLLTQRTRLQYVMDAIERSTFRLPPEAEPRFKDCLEAIRREFRTLLKLEQHYLRADSRLASRGTKLSNIQMMDSLVQLTALVDCIEFVFRAESSTTRGRENSTHSLVSVENRRLSDENKVQAQEQAQKLFRSLCFICEKLLKMISSHSVTLKDTFLSYLLWARVINSENIIAIFTQPPAEIDYQRGPNLLKIHYELLAQMGCIFIQISQAFNLESQGSGKETLNKLHQILNKVQDAGIENFSNCTWDFDQNEDDFEGVRTFAAVELTILVDSLLSSLPSLLHKSRLLQAKAPLRVRNDVSLPFESEEEQTSTKELLEVAVQLTAGISEAFEEMHKDKHSTSRIPVEEALRDLYDKEVTALLKWKEANGSKLGGKMTLQNQGVWEALQATVFNMTNLLNSISNQAKASNATNPTLNAKTHTLLADYAQKHKQLDLAIEANQDHDLNEMVRDFGEFVHVLISLQAPLVAIKPPPTHDKRHGDQMMLNTQDKKTQRIESDIA